MSAATRLRIVAAIITAALLASAASAAQFSGSLSGPVLGYVFDRHAGKLRPVRGILGSSTVGAPIESGFAISSILPLDARHAVASPEGGSNLVALTLDGTESSAVAISGVPANPTRSAASPAGTVAAFYYSGSQDVRIVTGLPQEPQQAAVVHIDKPVTQMAVSAEGTMLLYAVTEDEGESLYAWTASSGGAKFLTSAASISGIAITPNGDVIVTDRGANEVFAIWDVGGAAVRKLLAGVEDGVWEPSSVAVSSGDRIYISNSESVLVLDTNGRFLKAIRCNCSISGVYPFRDSVFRLTDGTAQTLYLLEATSAGERIFFVPPPHD
jgi:WD40 repeat protein